MLKFILYSLSLIYSLIVFIRNILYNLKIIKSYEFKIPIICFGNLNLGGSGKTPHTEYLISFLKNKYKVAYLSRGYKRKTKRFTLANQGSSIKEIGDESKQIKKKFNEIIVAVDRDRVRGVNTILQNFPDTQLIIMDDGLQHRRIIPSLKILLTKYSMPYYLDKLLPLGKLREHRHRAISSQIQIITKCSPNLTSLHKQEIINNIMIKDKKNLFFSSIKYSNKIYHKNGYFDISKLKEKNLLLLTAIADPSYLIEYLHKKKIEFNKISFRDHYQIKNRDISKINSYFSKEKKEDKFILTTEKDYVRFYETKINKEILGYIPIKIEIENSNYFETKIIDHIDHRLNCKNKV